ncbi:MAG TPA: CARDB domain-containing protein [Solirubrobacterales bacterium]|nr:CARDB domain-containing protein [Solirubrobacterales bacterium]
MVFGLAVMVATLLAALGPSHASAIGSGSISGTVTGGATEGQLILAGPCVAAYDSFGTRIDQVRAGPGGHYMIGDLDTGEYRLEIIDCAARLDLAKVGLEHCVGAAAANCLLPGLPSEFYDNRRTLAEATPVSVTDGVATTGIDARLGVDGGISGTVTDSSGAGLGGICVEAHYSGGYPAGTVGHTSSSGQYQVNGLGAGPYWLKFSDCLDPITTTEYHDNPVSVMEDTITEGVDAQLVTKSGPPDPTVYRAAIGEVSVKGPAKVKKGRQVTYKVKITNTGNIEATGVTVKVRGRGVSFGAPVRPIAAGASTTVSAKLKPKKPGKLKLTFKVTSANAGGKSVGRGITVSKPYRRGMVWHSQSTSRG